MSSTQTWSVNRRAARAVVLGSRDAAEARRFLDMLGLVDGPRGREVLPDDARRYDVPTFGAVPAADPDGSPIALTVAAERGDRMTTPAGLRALPTPAAPTKPTRKRQSLTDDLAELERITSRPIPKADLPQPTSEVPVPEPASPPTDSYKHGSRGGYQGHRRRGEEACEPCRVANRDFQRAYAAAKTPAAAPAAPRRLAAVPHPPAAPALAPIVHGTADGWRTHHARGALPVCDPCENAHAAERMAVSAVDLDVWIGAAQLSPTRTVRVLARVASTQLHALHLALDDLARAERAARPAEAR